MDKIILASIPRCGSTYVYRSVCGLEPGSSFPEPDGFNNFSGISVPYKVRIGRRIYKTHLPHRYLEDSLSEEDCIIFLYGDIYDAVYSTYLKRFEKNHFRNCGYSGRRKNIFKEDFLDYSGIFNSWKDKGLSIHYDDLKKRRTDIEDYINMDVSWNGWKERRNTDINNLPEKERHYMLETYEELDSQIKKFRNDTLKGEEI